MSKAEKEGILPGLEIREGSQISNSKVLDPEWLNLEDLFSFEVKEVLLSGEVNNMRNIDSVFNELYQSLENGDIVHGTSILSQWYKRKYAGFARIGNLLYFFDFCIHRVFPKLTSFTNKLYFFVTGGKNQRLSKTEVLGRLVKCGFSIMSEVVGDDGILRFSVKRDTKSDIQTKASYWPVFAMKRVGKNGHPINVYKFRTMHSHAEYLQEYVRQKDGLDNSGKFSNDFRVANWGRWMRKCWIDEIPMLVNLLKGDINLIGVRPISYHFLSLYPSNLREYRNRFKPGLIPPYYADLPAGFVDIVESERKYLEKFEKNPWKTNWQYLLAIGRNILFRRVRSK